MRGGEKEDKGQKKDKWRKDRRKKDDEEGEEEKGLMKKA